jgi:hypothetical protein
MYGTFAIKRMVHIMVKGARLSASLRYGLSATVQLSGVFSGNGIRYSTGWVYVSATIPASFPMPE